MLNEDKYVNKEITINQLPDTESLPEWLSNDGSLDSQLTVDIEAAAKADLQKSAA